MKARRFAAPGLTSAALALSIATSASAQTAPPAEPPGGQHDCVGRGTSPNTSGQEPGFVGQLASQQAEEGQNASGARGEQARGFTQAFANCGQKP
jgi:hypothetical protein